MDDRDRRVVPLLDLSCLRSFVAVGRSGSISAAASLVHLSQAAVSLQMQRLEDQLGRPLLLRHSRGVRLTAAGEAFLPLAQRVLDANREAVMAVLGGGDAGTVRLGAPHDVLHPGVTAAIRRFAESHPAHEVALQTASSRDLRDRFASGELDVIVTTDFDVPEGARPIGRRRVGWVAARGSGLAFRRPVPLAFTRGCVFRAKALAALDEAGVRFVHAVESGDVRAVEAAVAADRGVHAMILDGLPPHLGIVEPEAGLPPLPDVRVNLHVADGARQGPAALGRTLEEAFAGEALATGAV